MLQSLIFMLQAVKTSMLRYACCIFLTFFSGVVFAQPKIDSIKATRNSLKNYEDSIAYYLALSNEYTAQRNADSGLLYHNLRIALYEQKDRKKEANNLRLYVCELYDYFKKYDDCLNCLDQLEPKIRDSENYVAKSKINRLYGLYYYNYKGEVDKALPYFLTNIKYIREGKKGDPFALQSSFQNAALSYTIKRQYTEALTLVEESLVYAKNSDASIRVGIFNSLSNLYKNTKNFNKALEASTQALEIANSINANSNYMATLHQQHGINFINVKKIDSAYVYFLKSIEGFKSLGKKDEAAALLAYIAAQKEEQGDLQSAQKWNDEALKLLTPGSKMYEELANFSTFNKMELFVKAKADSSYSKAEKEQLSGYLQKLNPYLDSLLKKEKQYLQDDIEAYRLLSKAFEKVDSLKRSLFYLNKSIFIQDSLYGPEKMKSFTDLESKILMEKERTKLLLEEETKRLELQKQAELKELKAEYEKKQALAKTAEERKRLLLEEDLKRREIEFKYRQEQDLITSKFEQQRQIAKIEQERKDAVAQAELNRSRNERNMSILGAGLALLMVGVTAWSYFQKRKDNKRIEQEKLRSDELLLNILPFEIAEELKANGKTVAKNYDEVSVLFTDFVGFTANSERIGVQELLNDLNICFTEFDNIMVRYGLEKIKTIGDAYLAVSGLPIKDENHAGNAIKAAIDILRFIEKRKLENPNTMDIRIGIHSGNVIAGIIGVKKFAYDIWGDTVNTAARMEQASSSGRINVSDETFQLAHHNFSFEPRGTVQVKGKGSINMYFVKT